MKTNALFAVGIVALLSACGDSVPAQPDAEPATGACTYFVQDSLSLPTDSNSSYDAAIDFDGDGLRENGVGELLAIFLTVGDWQADIDLAFADGRMVMLHRIQADDPANDASVDWLIYRGQETMSPPLYDGSDVFSVAADSPRDTVLHGSIENGRFSGQAQRTITLALPFAPSAVELTLLSPKTEIAQVDTSGPARITTGRWGGAVNENDVRTLLPVLLAPANEELAVQCSSSGGTCVCPNGGSLTEALVGWVDNTPVGNGDCVVSVDEFIDSPVFGSLVRPDVDALDSDGQPGHDGVRDSLSLGFTFTAVEAQFDATCPQ